jgi:signal peptidase I
MPLPSIGALPCTSAAFAELSEEMLRAGTSLRFQARGYSMHPLVRDGDVLLVQPVKARELAIGDVVLASSGPARIVVHRVVRRQTGPAGSEFVLQGDQLARPDGLIPEAQVYGRLVAIERGGVQIALDRLPMKMLNVVAALCSRWNLSRRRWFRLAGRLARRLPVLSRYLA